MGSCTAGGAYVPAMSDETRDRPRPGHDLPRRPAAGEGRDRRGDQRRGSGRRRHCTARKSGVVDHLAENDEHALTIVRDIVCHAAAAAHRPTSNLRDPRPPKFDAEELYGIVPQDVRAPYDVHEVIARLVDGSEFHEFKALYGTHAGLRLRAHLGHAGGDPRQQRRAVLRKRAEGRALHRARLPAPHPAAVPPEHLRLHGRRQVRGGGHRQARRQAGHRGRHRQRAQDHRADRRQLRRGQLRHVRPRLFARASCSPGPTRGSA